ncbi:thioesterase II family protein [Paenibacillus nicotianae]|uniref:Thioesterase II family protein n=1 Tax=Paenibacillus nicotianae TaxID=1526551 RepID=A0ABW4UR44_9BACL
MKTLLFCLPYAGGSATIYHVWRNQLKDHIELYPIELPGHGSRYDEPYAQHFEALLDDVMASICSHLGNHPYVIYGHSMGAVLAYELYYKLVQEGYHPPAQIILAARPAPHSSYSQESKWAQLKDKLLSILPIKDSRIPSEIANYPHLAKQFKNTLSADIQALSFYRIPDQRSIIDCPLIVFAGTKDHIPRSAIEAWEEYTSKRATIYWLEGDHFFIHSHTAELISIINKLTLATSYK